MIVLAVDDEKYLLQSIITEIQTAIPDSTVYAFSENREAVDFINKLINEKQTLDFAFLDVRLGGCTGFDLAEKIQSAFPSVRIIFCTSYREYAFDAYAIHAEGYLLKPVKAENIIDLLKRSGSEDKSVNKRRVRIQTFGNFDVFVDGKLVLFNKGKAKELLAYLVDRKGAGVTAAEMSAVLWDGCENGINLNNNLQHTKKDLKNILNSYGISDIVIFGWNCLALDVSKVECDFYRFLASDMSAIDSFMGEYMKNYDWAEFTAAELFDRKKVFLSKIN
ncbi:MAG: response regulator [Candidatus Borkfalkiaceae bacterium]|nr:response regulator [Christensenellaceae bacterium]